MLLFSYLVRRVGGTVQKNIENKDRIFAMNTPFPMDNQYVFWGAERPVLKGKNGYKLIDLDAEINLLLEYRGVLPEMNKN